MILEVLVSLSLLLNLIILVILVTRRLARQVESAVKAQMQSIDQGQNHLTHALQESLLQARQEAQGLSQLEREELASNFQRWSGALGQTIERELKRGYDHQKASGDSLVQMAEHNAKALASFSQDLVNREETHYRHTMAALSEASTQQKRVLDSFQMQLTTLITVNEEKLDSVRRTVEQKLTDLQHDNAAKLEQMRVTVDEKLHQTLEQRLGDSFRLVSERLEQVQRGLGEMQSLASGVGDLKKVLTNVKTRGTLGEIQLESLLEQTLSHDQYQKGVATSPNTSERVDFAIRLPGKRLDDDPVWLPVDAKFPLEDYQRLLDAEEHDDHDSADEAARLLEQRIRTEAKSIQAKYLHPPHTTDFALMFLPLEGLYAEILRRPGLWDTLQREHHIIVTGPTTISAILNSFQMGFRTLAIEQRSSEVWKLLGGVKTEFKKFGEVLEKTQKKLQEASNTIDHAATRSRAIERRLRNVEALPDDAASSPLHDSPEHVLAE